MSSVIDAGTCIRTNQLDFDDEAVFLTRKKLFDIARQGNQQPFLLLMSLTHPHDPFAIPQPYLDRYSPQDIDLPQVSAAQVPSDPHSRRLRKIYQLTDDLLSDEQIRRARHAYYGAVSYVDDQFGAVLTTLEETGLAEDTIVLVISDHGEMLGERGLWYKMGFFEGAARIRLSSMRRTALPSIASTPASRWPTCCPRWRSWRAASRRRCPRRWPGTVCCPICAGKPGTTAFTPSIWRKARWRPS